VVFLNMRLTPPKFTLFYTQNGHFLISFTYFIVDILLSLILKLYLNRQKTLHQKKILQLPKIFLIGHEAVLHREVFKADPLHGFLFSGRSMHWRVFSLNPPPQLTLHSDHCDQLLQCPSKTLFLLNVHIKFIIFFVITNCRLTNGLKQQITIPAKKLIFYFWPY
jgi:hypothetical protein